MTSRALLCIAILLVCACVISGHYPRHHRPDDKDAKLKQKSIYTASGAQPAPVKSIDQLPKQHDWCDYNGVSYCTASWNQHIPKYCGACWIHGALGQANDRLKIALGAKHDVMLARQVILNCAESKGFGSGCNGGDGEDVFEYLHQYGLPDESCQLYKAESNPTCEPIDVCMNCMPIGEEIFPFKCWPVSPPIMYYAKEYGKVSGEAAMMSEILARGPITCGFATADDFDYNYRGGIYIDTTNATEVDHDVEVVGWGEENGVKYWKARNSWGTYWGENSFFKILRGTNMMRFEEDCTFVIMDTHEVEQVLAHKHRGGMFGIVEESAASVTRSDAHGHSAPVTTTALPEVSSSKDHNSRHGLLPAGEKKTDDVQHYTGGKSNTHPRAKTGEEAADDSDKLAPTTLNDRSKPHHPHKAGEQDKQPQQNQRGQGWGGDWQQYVPGGGWVGANPKHGEQQQQSQQGEQAQQGAPHRLFQRHTLVDDSTDPNSNYQGLDWQQYVPDQASQGQGAQGGQGQGKDQDAVVKAGGAATADSIRAGSEAAAVWSPADNKYGYQQYMGDNNKPTTFAEPDAVRDAVIDAARSDKGSAEERKAAHAKLIAALDDVLKEGKKTGEDVTGSILQAIDAIKQQAVKEHEAKQGKAAPTALVQVDEKSSKHSHHSSSSSDDSSDANADAAAHWKEVAEQYKQDADKWSSKYSQQGSKQQKPTALYDNSDPTYEARQQIADSVKSFGQTVSKDTKVIGESIQQEVKALKDQAKQSHAAASSSSDSKSASPDAAPTTLAETANDDSLDALVSTMAKQRDAFKAQGEKSLQEFKTKSDALEAELKAKADAYKAEGKELKELAEQRRQQLVDDAKTQWKQVVQTWKQQHPQSKDQPAPTFLSSNSDDDSDKSSKKSSSSSDESDEEADEEKAAMMLSPPTTEAEKQARAAREAKEDEKREKHWEDLAKDAEHENEKKAEEIEHTIAAKAKAAAKAAKAAAKSSKHSNKGDDSTLVDVSTLSPSSVAPTSSSALSVLAWFFVLSVGALITLAWYRRRQSHDYQIIA